MIETSDGIANADEIMSHQDNGIYIGPADLALSGSTRHGRSPRTTLGRIKVAREMPDSLPQVFIRPA